MSPCLVAFAFFACVSGCGSASDAVEPSTDGIRVTNHGCALPQSGSYEIRYTALADDTCLVPPSAITQAQPVQGSSCRGGSGTIEDTATSGGGCHVVAALDDCPVEGTSHTAAFREDLVWTADGTAATGSVHVDAHVAGPSCAGAFAVTLVRLP
jgi:hypothetical protein